LSATANALRKTDVDDFFSSLPSTQKDDKVLPNSPNMVRESMMGTCIMKLILFAVELGNIIEEYRHDIVMMGPVVKYDSSGVEAILLYCVLLFI
jgi:hypothetical protein